MGRMRASANEQSGRWSCARQHQRGRGTPPRARFVCFLQINDSTYPSMALEAQNASQPARCCALGRSRSLWFARVHSGPSWSILVHPGPSWSILVRSRALACTRVHSRALAFARVRSRALWSAARRLRHVPRPGITKPIFRYQETARLYR